MKTRKTNRMIALLMALVLCLSCAAPALAETKDTASSVKVVKTEGTVAVSNAAGRSMTMRQGMNLNSGYGVSTGAASYLWLDLDESKTDKLDASSELELRKAGKKLELLLKEGSLFFNVTKPLREEESLNIRTSSMVVGIRGTCGWVKVLDQNRTRVYLLEGSVTCTVTDPITGQSKTCTLTAGQCADFVVYSSGKGSEHCDILMNRFGVGDIDGFVLVELVGDPTLVQKIYASGGIDLRNVTQALAEARLAADQRGRTARLEQIAALDAAQLHVVSQDPVWEQPGAEGAGASGGGTPALPNTITFTVADSQTDIQAALNNPQYTTVYIQPSAGVSTLNLSGSFTVPTGKTLDARTQGANVAFSAGSATVDGTLNTAALTNNSNTSLTVNGTVNANTLQNSGVITVNSPSSLHVQGSTVNDGQLLATANGFIELQSLTNTRDVVVEGQGRMTCTTLDNNAGPVIGAMLLVRGNGSLTATGGITGSGDITLQNSAVVNARVVVSSGTFTMDATARLTSDHSDGTLTFTGGTLNLNGGTLVSTHASAPALRLDLPVGSKPVINLSGTELSSEGQAVVDSADPTKAADEVLDGIANVVVETDPVTGKQVVTRVYSVNLDLVYLITDDAYLLCWGGSGPQLPTTPEVVQTFRYGETFGSRNGNAMPVLPDSDHREQVFDGWYTGDGTPVTPDTEITGDITFYARWKPGGQLFLYEADSSVDPISSTPVPLLMGERVSTPALTPPVHGGYTFQGWRIPGGDKLYTDQGGYLGYEAGGSVVYYLPTIPGANRLDAVYTPG